MAGHARRRAWLLGASGIVGLLLALGLSVGPAAAAPYPPIPATTSLPGPIVGVGSPVNPGAIGITPAPRAPGGAAIAPGAFPVQAQTGSPPQAPSNESSDGVAILAAAAAVLGAGVIVAWRRRAA